LFPFFDCEMLSTILKYPAGVESDDAESTERNEAISHARTR